MSDFISVFNVSKFRKIYHIYFSCSTLLYFIGIASIVFFGFNEKNSILKLMMVSTLVYAAIGYILPFLIMMSERQKDGSDPSDSYIKLNYPDIWKKLHPLGGRSWNGFELKAFLNDKYDNLSDNKLQEIKKGLKEFLHFQWAAILSWPIFWISISIINCIKNACLK